jgi:hypothetical protein
MEGERRNNIDRRHFLKGVVETTVGGVLFIHGFGHLAAQVLREKGILAKAKSEVPEQEITPHDKAEEGNPDSKNLTYVLEEVVGGPLSAKGMMDICTARKRGEAARQNGQLYMTQGDDSGTVT